MENTIKTESDNEFTINGKPVYLDHNNKWIAKHLTQSELQAASNHIITLQTPKAS